MPAPRVVLAGPADHGHRFEGNCPARSGPIDVAFARRSMPSRHGRPMMGAALRRPPLCRVASGRGAESLAMGMAIAAVAVVAMVGWLPQSIGAGREVPPWQVRRVSGDPCAARRASGVARDRSRPRSGGRTLGDDARARATREDATAGFASSSPVRTAGAVDWMAPWPMGCRHRSCRPWSLSSPRRV